MKTLMVLVLLLLSLVQVVPGLYYYWQNSSPGQRYMKEGSLMVSVVSASTTCGIHCTENVHCLSFNHNGVTQECELLNTVPYLAGDHLYLANETDWSHFSVYVPEKVFNATALCPVGSVLLPYEQPAYSKHDYDLPGYACTAHTYVLNQVALGHTDCRMVIKYATNFLGYDHSQFPHNTLDLGDTMPHCYHYGCLSVVCYVRGNCWIKYESHLSKNTGLTSQANVVYWYAVCQ
ncbi:uncharacterized protein LOC121878836 [Homarus americanus]|uniref:uncharacterized protein LOC121878836 n=1 Tax=Homarus americanus TaxID=6706 RepID=UPI001C463125|nr:uncharacterized protein LOC121878836 [Homarus americanus]